MSKRKKTIPRVKKMNQKQRLASARSWILEYKGNNIIQGYRKHFDTDLLGSALELQKLGVFVDPSYIEQLNISVENKTKDNHSRKQKKKDDLENDRLDECDDQYYYIAGYTSNGVPFGTTWTEMGLEPYDFGNDN